MYVFVGVERTTQKRLRTTYAMHRNLKIKTVAVNFEYFIVHIIFFIYCICNGILSTERIIVNGGGGGMTLLEF